jgi:hypothetical protein
MENKELAERAAKAVRKAAIESCLEAKRLARLEAKRFAQSRRRKAARRTL